MADRDRLYASLTVRDQPSGGFPDEADITDLHDCGCYCRKRRVRAKRGSAGQHQPDDETRQRYAAAKRYAISDPSAIDARESVCDCDAVWRSAPSSNRASGKLVAVRNRDASGREISTSVGPGQPT